MRRKTRALALAAALALLMAAGGCSAPFEKEYYAHGPYQAPAAQEDAADAAYDDISNYAALRRAIVRLVTDHVESAQLQFTNYDGSISQDLSAACWEVKSSTAMGAFAVDYISFDLSRIVSYYQAELNITYKRSAAQLEALERTATVSSLMDRLADALREGETYLVLMTADASATADRMRQYVASTYRAEPLACPVMPEVEVGLYPETGVTRIAEISLNYGLEPEELAQRREALGDAMEALNAAVPPPEEDAPEPPADQGARLQALCGYITGLCRADDGAGPTAWDALTQGRADSQGMALALEACCQTQGIRCQVVEGRRDNQPHYWNIVDLDGACYHVDVSAGGQEVFLAGDDQLWGIYWWDISQYPACPAAFSVQAPEGADAPEPLSAAA